MEGEKEKEKELLVTVMGGGVGVGGSGGGGLEFGGFCANNVFFLFIYLQLFDCSLLAFLCQNVVRTY